MLQRIYGTCFPKKEELDAYLARIEEAKKRDHRKLGKELGLFTFMDEGPGFPFFLPKGMVLKNQLIDYWRAIHKKAGYVEISTPIMLNQDLWHRSGHWDHYKDNMYTTVIDDVPFALKPMNCRCVSANSASCTAMNCPAPCTACSASAASRRTMRTSS